MDEVINNNELSFIDNKIFAVSKDFARLIKSFTKNEFKTLALALSKINFKGDMDFHVEIDKKELAEFLGFHSDTNHMSQNIYNEIKNMPIHSALEFYKEENKVRFSGVLISNIVVDRTKTVKINFNEEAAKHFSHLLNGNFIIMLTRDIQSLTSIRSILFYEFLRLHSDTRVTNTYIMSVREMKELFGINKTGKGSYMSKDGHFQRTRFEDQVIKPICEDLSKTKLITLILNDNKEKYYQKIKENGNIKGYKFTWVINDISMDKMIETTINSNTYGGFDDDDPEYWFG